MNCVIKVNVSQKRVNVAQRTDFVEQILLHQKKKKKRRMCWLNSAVQLAHYLPKTIRVNVLIDIAAVWQ